MRLGLLFGLTIVMGCGNGGGGTTCRFNSDCPSGRYCAAGTCRADCASDAECVTMLGAGAVCSSFGMCTAAPDADVTTPDMGMANDAAVVPTDAGMDAATTDGGSDAGGDGGGDSGSDAGHDSATDAYVPVPYTSVSVGDTTSFDVARATPTVVLYSSELHDDGDEFDGTTGTFTATHAGVYRVCASILAPGGVGVIELDVFVNGTRERVLAQGTGLARGCGVIRLAAADTLDVRVVWDRPGTIPTNIYWNWLTIDEEERVGTSVSVRDMAAFDAPHATFTKLPYAAAVYDSAGSSWDAAMHRFTTSHPGDFEICASVAVDDPSVAFEIDLFVDGARTQAIGAGSGTVNGCRVVRLDGARVVEVWAYQASGATQHFSASAVSNWLTVQELPRGGAAISLGDSATFSVPTTSFVRVPYASEAYDDTSEFDAATSRWTATTPGDYLVCASLYGHSIFELDLFVDDARERGFAYAPPMVGTGCRVVRLDAGAVVDVRMYEPGAGVSVGPNGIWNWLVIHALH